MKTKTINLESSERITILKATKKENEKIKSFCNVGLCGRCTVKVKRGNVSQPSKKEIRKLGIKRIEQGYRLACQTTFKGKITLEI